MARGLAKLELVLEAIDRATAPLRSVERAIGSVERAAARSTGVMTRLGDVGGKALRVLGNAAKFGALAGITAVAAGLAVGLKEAIEFESAMADIAKVADFSSPAGLASMSDAILKMSQTIPVAATGLAKITAEAIQAGISTQDALDFTDLVARSSVAFDMTADAAGEAFAKIRNIFTLDQGGLREVADATNYLSNVMASKAPEIIDFLARAGGAAPLLKMSAVEMGALGSTMISLGVAPETAARGVTKLFTALKTGDKKTEKALKVLGFTRKEFLKLAEIDPGAAFEKFFKAIDQSGEKGLGALVDIVGQDFADDFLKLASNSKMVGEAFRYVADHAKYAGSVLKEYQARAATTANNWQLFKNNLAVLRIEAISRALPTINGFLDRINKIMMTLDQRTTLFERVGAAWSGFVNGLGVQPLEGAAQAVSALGDALEKFLFGTVDERDRDPLAGVFASARAAGAALRPVLDGIGQAAEAALRAIEKLGSVLKGLWNDAVGALTERFPGLGAGLRDFAAGAGIALLALGAFSIAAGAALSVGSALVGIVAGLATTFGVVGWAAAAAAGLITANWDTIGPYFQSVADQIAAAWPAVEAAWGQAGAFFADAFPDNVPGVGALEGLADALNGVIEAMGGLASFTGKSLVSFFRGFFDGFEPYIRPIVAQLADIWNQVGPILKNFGDIGTQIGGMFAAIGANSNAMGAIQTLGSALGQLSGIVANVSLTGIEGLLRFIEMVSGVTAALMKADWNGARAAIQGFVDWLGSLSFGDLGLDFTLSDLLPDFSAEDIKAKFRGWFDFDLKDVLPDWSAAFNMPEIAIDTTQLRAALDRVVALVRGAWAKLKEIFQEISTAAQQAADAIRKPFQYLADNVGTFDPHVGEGGFARPIRDFWSNMWGDGPPEAPTIASPAAPTIPAPVAPSLDSLNASQDQVDRLNAAIGAASAAGQALPSAIADALSAADAAVKSFDLAADGARIMASFNAGLSTGGMQAAATVRATVASIRAAASLDLTQQGMNIMNTLAAGMRARAAAVVEQIRGVTQAVRDHLPNSPAKTGPLSDIHRLRFTETIAKSIRPEPMVRAMHHAAGAGMDALAPLQRQLRIGAGAAAKAPQLGEARSRTAIAAAAAQSAGGGGGGSINHVDASLHIGEVHFSKPEDKQEFEALLRRHSKTVAEVVAGEDRRRSRVSFRGEAA